MTSDKFARVRVADIVVEERQRKDLGDLSGLADSIGDLEQLQAVVITRWTENGLHKLVSGGRRLGAVKARRDEFIDVRFTDERDPIKLMEMEFAENDQRLDGRDCRSLRPWGFRHKVSTISRRTCSPGNRSRSAGRIRARRAARS